MKAKAAVAWEAGKPLEIEEIEVAGPLRGEVLLRVVATGVCHWDYNTLQHLPVGAAGHECEVQR